MKRVLLTILFLITSFVFQGTFFRILDFNNIVPNLMIIVTVSTALLNGEKYGITVGFFCGLLMDIFNDGSSLGFYALIYMYIGYFNGGFTKIFFPDDVKLPIFLVVISDFIYGFSVYVLLFLLRGRTGFGFYFGKIILPEMIYTVVVTLIVYPIILRIHKLLLKGEIRKAQKFVS